MRPTVKLWEICDILDKRRKPITQKDRTKWIYPYYWASWILDYVADYIFDEDLVLIWEDWAKWGALDNSAFKVSWKVWVNNHAHVIRPHREKILDDFLVYFLVSSDLSDYITWTTVPKLNQERLKLIQIPLPPIETQKAIVAKLDQIFAELDQTKSEIQKNLDNTDELWKSALNQAFQGDWEMKKLGEVAEIQNWWTPKTEKKEYWDWDILWITPKDMWELNSKYVEDTSRKISKLWLNNSSAKLLPINSVILSSRAPIWYVAINTKPISTNQGCKWIIPNDNLKAEYLYYFLILSNKLLNSLGSGATFKELSSSKLWEVEIPVPPLSEQEKIVEHLDQVSKEVKELKSQYQSQLDNLEELKKSVLDKAFRWELEE